MYWKDQTNSFACLHLRSNKVASHDDRPHFIGSNKQIKTRKMTFLIFRDPFRIMEGGRAYSCLAAYHQRAIQVLQLHWWPLNLSFLHHRYLLIMLVWRVFTAFPSLPCLDQQETTQSPCFSVCTTKKKMDLCWSVMETPSRSPDSMVLVTCSQNVEGRKDPKHTHTATTLTKKVSLAVDVLLLWQYNLWKLHRLTWFWPCSPVWEAS